MEQLLAWERGLLQAETLDQWLERAALTPDGAGAALLLADPTHELRPLLLGGCDLSDSLPLELQCVASLAGLAPHLLAMRSAWRGDYQKADHALLFPRKAGLRHVVILPLHRAGRVIGLYTAGSVDAQPFDALGIPLLDHASDVIVASLDRHLDQARALRGGLVDPLTGWNSPRYLKSRLREELARGQREGTSVSCLVADVDRLQALNDELGYAAGDRALYEFTARIEAQVRSSDATARIGSDSFGIVLPATEAALAAPLAERILAAMRAAPVETGNGVARDLRVSIGIASCRPQPGQDLKLVADQLVADAVAALHRAKRAGGDRYEIQPA
jgi:diguanylate cyclase (GGDEF)-like protein